MTVKHIQSVVRPTNFIENPHNIYWLMVIRIKTFIANTSICMRHQLVDVHLRKH